MKIIPKKLDRALLPMKAHYFLWNAGTGPVQTFLSIYARQLGFSSSIVGVIFTVLPICGMIAKPITGYIADVFHCQKKIFIIVQLLTAAAFLSIYYSPGVPVERRVHFSCADGLSAFNTENVEVDDCLFQQIQMEHKTVNCQLDCKMESEYWTVVCEQWNVTQFCQSHPDRLKFTAQVPLDLSQKFKDTVVFRVPLTEIDGTTYHPKCPDGNANHISTYCNLDCDDYTINELIEKPTVEDSDVYGLYQFWVCLFVMILGWTGQAIVVSIGDAICFELLGDKPQNFGYQRLFGSLGWGLFSPIGGFLIDTFSEGQSYKNFLPAFIMAIILLILDFSVSTRLQYTQQKISTGVLRDVGRLLVDVRIFVFLLSCVSVGLCTGLIWNFLYWLIEDLAKAQGCDSLTWIKTLEGLIQAVQCICGEMLFLFLSGWILKRIGHVHTMSLVLLGIGVRFILYSVISNPWYFLPVELLNGLTYGLFYACMASYISIVAPPGTEATMQGMAGAVFEGVGVSLGSLLAGTLFQKYGGQLTFRIFGIGSLIVCLAHAAVQFLMSVKDKNTKYALPADALQIVEDGDEQELALVSELKFL